MKNENSKNQNVKSLEELKLNALQNIELYYSSQEAIDNQRMVPSMIVNLYWDISNHSQEFKKIVTVEHEQYDEIYADVVSSLDNANCSCRGRFASFIAENKVPTLESYKRIIDKITENEKKALEEALKKQETLFRHIKIENENKKGREEFEKNNAKLKKQEEIQKTSENSSEYDEFFSRYLEGNVIEIEDSPEAYGNLIKNLRMSGEFYRGLNILQKPNNKIWVYLY